MRSFSGQSGQVSALFSFTGGFGMISSWVTDSAPWRIEVPMQSDPVSPPPMTMTCLPPARIGMTLPSGSSLTRRFCCGRNSMAKWMPSSSRPGIGRSRGFSAPPESAMASCRSRSSVIGKLGADMDVAMEDDALGLHLRDAPVDVELLHLEVGDAVAEQAAGRGVLLVDDGPRARRGASCWAQARPAGPEPITATLFPVVFDGGSGLTQPISKPRSTMAHSIVLMVTGLSLMLSVQDASQGAGQTRPVNSGKLLVEWRLRSASCQSPL